MGGEEERMMERDSMITMTERHSHAERIIKIPGNGLGSLEQWGSTCEFCGKGLLGCLLELSSHSNCKRTGPSFLNQPSGVEF